MLLWELGFVLLEDICCSYFRQGRVQVGFHPCGPLCQEDYATHFMELKLLFSLG